MSNNLNKVYLTIKVYLCKINDLTALEVMYHFEEGNYKGSLDKYECVGTIQNQTLSEAYSELNNEYSSLNISRSFSVGDILQVEDDRKNITWLLCKPEGWEELSI